MYFDKDIIHKLFRVGGLFVAILVVMDLLTYFFYPNTVMGKIFLATREQTPLTWVSSMVLLFIGLSCAAQYVKTKAKIWYFLALTYFFFSMDDAVYFHERFSGALQGMFTKLGEFPSYSWVVIYFPLLAFGLFGLLFLLWRDSSKQDKKMLVFAVLILGSAIFLDMLDGFVDKNEVLVFCLDIKCNASVVHLMRLTEEVLEVIGFGMLAFLNIREHYVSHKFNSSSA